MQPFGTQIDKIIDSALVEDLEWGDITTEMLIVLGLQGECSIISKAVGVLAGIEVARAVFNKVDPSLEFEAIIRDGMEVHPGEAVAAISGAVASILKGERVALNFLQRLSGIASETARYVKAVAQLPVSITDTRKTSPGLRVLEKYAVRVGGGKNHRYHLGDGILIKDNHLTALRSTGEGLTGAIQKARHQAPHLLKVEVEVETLDEALQAVEAGADILLLDNMGIEEMRRVVKEVRGRAVIETSGGITLDNVRSVAETGVNLISIGALTHSSKALDFSLELKP